MLKKSIFLVVTVMVLGSAVAPMVQAQTAAQQQELEQIARRSMNGLSAQDRQRVVQIMTDVYVAQGMPQQQAAALAEMTAGSMFSSDIGEMSAEDQRLFAEQEQRLRDFDQAQRQPQQPQQQRLPGENAGWPAAQLRAVGIPDLRQPAGTNASYDGDADWVYMVYLSGANAAVFNSLRQQIETITGNRMDQRGNEYDGVYATQGSGRMSSQSHITISLDGTTIKIRLWSSGA